MCGQEPDYTVQMKKLKDFLDKNDKEYFTEHKISEAQINSYPKLTLKLPLANQIITLNAIINGLTTPMSKFANKKLFIAYLEGIYKNILDIIANTFLKTKEEITVFARVRYIIMRGFRQFGMLNEICPSIVGDSPIKIAGGLNQIY